MAHTKAGGVTKGNRNARAKRLGVKLYQGQKVGVGQIIVRQKGSHIHSGVGVKQGRDFTLYALTEGEIAYKRKMGKTIVNIV